MKVAFKIDEQHLADIARCNLDQVSVGSDFFQVSVDVGSEQPLDVGIVHRAELLLQFTARSHEGVSESLYIQQR